MPCVSITKIKRIFTCKSENKNKNKTFFLDFFDQIDAAIACVKYEVLTCKIWFDFIDFGIFVL